MNPMQDVYLDNAATTPLASEVRAGMLAYLEHDFGNPSSRHPLGIRAREAVDAARRRVALAVGARPEGIVFTSGGTEANNLGVLGAARLARAGAAGKRSETERRRILIGPTEHACVRGAAEALGSEGFAVETLALDARGNLDLDHLEQRLADDVAVVAVMLVNNEFGSVYPVREVARLARRKAPRAHVHVDAVQAFGKLDVALDELECASLAISAHKVHGPKGAGALALAEGRRVLPLFFGGGQEHGLRSGTENVAGLVGLGLAAERCVAQLEQHGAHCRRARAVLAQGVAALEGARLIEPGDRICDAVASVFVPGVPAEVRMHHLERAGVHVSAGSACQAAKRDLSPALLALGLSIEDARRVLRVSFALSVPLVDIERAVETFVRVSHELEAIVS